ncbi:MAG TPA: MBL fold metallo-hydrolase [Nannocystaceae bacterium]|nr:MBL fold metallo-hydrolase [Nannocystaceae bacterium]
MPTLTFLGGTDTVTGSKALLEHEGVRVLVDCGLFQGLKDLRLRNWSPLPIDARSIDAVVLTHAHIDHSGYLPALCRDGFAGPVFCSAGTRDLLQVLLPDSGHLQEEQARHANLRGWSRHHPALPLYTRREAELCLPRLRPIAFGERFTVARGITAQLARAGHIIGAASVRLELGGHAITFSGDIGRPNDPLMRAPELLAPTDTLVVESTYGDRRHPATDVVEDLARVLDDTWARGGAVIVPAFAVGRAQHLLHAVAQLRRTGRMRDVPVYLDSPMAIAATRIFRENAGDHRLDPEACREMCEAATYTSTPEQSMAIDASGGPMLVVSASGMATGGRVLHHLKRFLPDPRNTVLLVGFQSAGTRGRALQDGVDELKIHGDYVKVGARVVMIEGLSAHADWAEIIEWLAASAIAPTRVFVNHGEPAAADALRRRLTDRFGWSVTLPHSDRPFALAPA